MVDGHLNLSTSHQITFQLAPLFIDGRLELGRVRSDYTRSLSVLVSKLGLLVLQLGLLSFWRFSSFSVVTSHDNSGTDKALSVLILVVQYDRKSFMELRCGRFVSRQLLILVRSMHLSEQLHKHPCPFVYKIRGARLIGVDADCRANCAVGSQCVPHLFPSVWAPSKYHEPSYCYHCVAMLPFSGICGNKNRRVARS